MPVRFHLHQAIVPRRSSTFIPQFSIGASHKCQFLHLLTLACARDSGKEKEGLGAECIYKSSVAISIGIILNLHIYAIFLYLFSKE